MAAEDRVLAMNVRRHVARYEADMAELDITASRGVVCFSGVLKIPRGFRGHLDLQEQLHHMVDAARRVAGVREVVVECRLLE